MMPHGGMDGEFEAAGFLSRDHTISISFSLNTTHRQEQQHGPPFWQVPVSPPSSSDSATSPSADPPRLAPGAADTTVNTSLAIALPSELRNEIIRLATSKTKSPNQTPPWLHPPPDPMLLTKLPREILVRIIHSPRRRRSRRWNNSYHHHRHLANRRPRD
jgi:hypothetical protein